MNRVKALETVITDQVASLSKVDSCVTSLYARAIEQEGAVPTAKAVLLNLIIYASDPDLADEAAEHATGVLSAVSCRAIVADLSSTQQTQGASVSLVCGISDRGDKRLCGEVIRLYAPQGSVTGSVMPLLLPDVPVYLWVHAEVPPEKDDFADLLRVANHVIVDSRIGPETAKNLRAAHRLSRAEGGKRIVQDLAWISLHSWREATAEHFDAPTVRHYLDVITEVTIRYSGSGDLPAPESPPLLFASWLMERTQINPRDAFRSRDEGFRIDARQDDRPVVVRLVPEDSEFEAGRLLCVAIKCGSGDVAGVFTTEAESANQLLLTEDCRDVCLPPKHLALPSHDEAALASVAVRYYGRDHVFDKALEVALQSLGQIELADERSARIRL